MPALALKRMVQVSVILAELWPVVFVQSSPLEYR